MNLVRRDYDPLDGFRSRARRSASWFSNRRGEAGTRSSRRNDDNRDVRDQAATFSRHASQRGDAAVTHEISI